MQRMLGVPIWDQGLDALVARSIGAVESDAPGDPFVFACANPHSLVVASRDAEFHRSLRTADAVVADGVGMQIAATLAGRRIGSRITGIDYFCGLMNALEERGGGRVAFFGSSAAVLQRLSVRVRERWPRISIVAAISPPYGAWPVDTDTRFIAEINRAVPDVLWVGMTAPKQEKWVREHSRSLCCPVVGSIGAVFDYFAGTVRRAPRWVCGLGLEWAYRLAFEPRRLWRRTFVSGPRFLSLAAQEAWRGSARWEKDGRAS
jgi:N-acetylglucosaminyldiphosphoundecaprenol N-acetyl-beta-D-mannosaminyltransferase